MKKKIIVLAMLLALAVSAAGCIDIVGDGSTPPPAATPASTADNSGSSSPVKTTDDGYDIIDGDGLYSYGDFAITIADGETYIDAYTGASSDMVMPDEIEGYPVVGVSENAFAGFTNIGTVTFSKNMREIGDGAFQSCTGIREIVIPEGIERIGKKAFYNCGKLLRVTVASTVKDIGGDAFRNTPWLKDLEDEFNIVGDGILIKYTGKSASVTVPDGVKKLVGAFDSCSTLQNVSLPSSLESIGYRAFYGCYELKNTDIPAGVTEIGDSAFHSCSGALTEMTLPDGVKSIGMLAFSNCRSLNKLVIPDSVESIGKSAFYSANENLKLYVGKGSAAEEYAEANGISYEAK